MAFITDLPLIERTILRRLPPCFQLERVELGFSGPDGPLPQNFAVMVTVRRCSADPEPYGWVHGLTQEIRAGWDRDQFNLCIRELPSDYESTFESP